MGELISRERAHEMLIGPGLPYEIEPFQISGVTLRTWKHAPKSLREVVEKSEKFGDSEFMILGNRRISYVGHYNLVCKLSHFLKSKMGVSKGDRVALVMRNLPEWSVAFWATTAIGAIIVPLNAWFTGKELQHCINDCGAKVAIVDFKRAKILRSFYGQLMVKRVIVTEEQESILAGPEISFNHIIKNSPDNKKLPDVQIGPDDDATIFYTSGTTGKPKGAVGSNRNICVNILTSNFRASVRQLCRGMTPRVLGGSPNQAKILVPVPFFHVTGCHAILAAGMYAGSKFILMKRWDVEEALKLISKEKITHVVGVPGMILQMLESEFFDEWDTSSITSISYGGAPAMKKLGDLISKHLKNVDAENGYGLTEASALVAYNAGKMYEKKSWSCGFPSPICDLEVKNKFSEPVNQGDVGEIFIRGSNVVRGYWNNQKETDRKFNNGWFATGDIGRIDRYGLLEILDRHDDILIRGGENIYTVEVENILVAYPGVIEAAVLGRDHPVLGQEVVAFVRTKPQQNITEEELILHCRKNLAEFKIPVVLNLTSDPLPTNAAGKILKRSLQKIITRA